jgi:hypothetical protein
MYGQPDPKVIFKFLKKIEGPSIFHEFFIK